MNGSDCERKYLKNIFDEKKIEVLFHRVAHLGSAAGLVSVATEPHLGDYRLWMVQVFSPDGFPEIAVAIEPINLEPTKKSDPDPFMLG